MTNRKNKGISTVYGSVLFLILVISLASALFLAFGRYDENVKAALALEEDRAHERIVLIELTTDNSSGTELIRDVSVNNTGSITVRIRAVYVDGGLKCDPSDFGDTYIKAKATKWINLLPAGIEYNKTANLALATERGIKSVENEGVLKGETLTLSPARAQKVYFGPLLLNFEKFY